VVEERRRTVRRTGAIDPRSRMWGKDTEKLDPIPPYTLTLYKQEHSGLSAAALKAPSHYGSRGGVQLALENRVTLGGVKDQPITSENVSGDRPGSLPERPNTRSRLSRTVTALMRVSFLVVAGEPAGAGKRHTDRRVVHLIDSRLQGRPRWPSRYVSCL